MHTGCFKHYYKVAKSPVIATPDDIVVLQNENRYFVLRSATNALYMRDLTLSGDRKTLKFRLDTLPPEHKLHLKKGHRRGNLQYLNRPPEKLVLSEVHLYIPEDTITTTGSYTLAIDKVQKIEVIQKDAGRTAGNYVLSSFAIIGTAFAIALIIAALSSCPFVSAYDGHDFVLQGEIYGGAIYPQLSRNDYIKLNMRPTSEGTLQLKISNELMEHQHTDLAELIIVHHNKDVKILADEQGNLYSIKNPQQPLSAITGNKNDVRNLLLENDNKLMEFDDSLSAKGNNEVLLHFSKPGNIDKGKLVLTLKNTYWLDYLYGKMTEGFGNYYNSFVKKQHNVPVETLKKWTKEQQIPLQVSVKTTEGWKIIANLTTIGPVATREMVVPVDLSLITEPFTDIKLSSGFMFWEIDYAAMDYSDNEIFTTEKLLPAIATDENDTDVSYKLSKADGLHLEQPLPGAVTTITYNYPVAEEGKLQSYFLHSKGYYEQVRDFKGKPDIAFLKQFKRPGAFPKFSLDMYKKEKQLNSANTVKK
jgi:hypothetical protein